MIRRVSLHLDHSHSHPDGQVCSQAASQRDVRLPNPPQIHQRLPANLHDFQLVSRAVIPPDNPVRNHHVVLLLSHQVNHQGSLVATPQVIPHLNQQHNQLEGLRHSLHEIHRPNLLNNLLMLLRRNQLANLAGNPHHNLRVALPLNRRLDPHVTLQINLLQLLRHNQVIDQLLFLRLNQQVFLQFNHLNSLRLFQPVSQPALRRNIHHHNHPNYRQVSQRNFLQLAQQCIQYYNLHQCQVHYHPVSHRHNLPLLLQHYRPANQALSQHPNRLFIIQKFRHRYQVLGQRISLQRNPLIIQLRIQLEFHRAYQLVSHHTIHQHNQLTLRLHNPLYYLQVFQSLDHQPAQQSLRLVSHLVSLQHTHLKPQQFPPHANHRPAQLINLPRLHR